MFIFQAYNFTCLNNSFSVANPILIFIPSKIVNRRIYVRGFNHVLFLKILTMWETVMCSGMSQQS